MCVDTNAIFAQFDLHSIYVQYIVICSTNLHERSIVFSSVVLKSTRSTGMNASTVRSKMRLHMSCMYGLNPSVDLTYVDLPCWYLL